MKDKIKRAIIKIVTFALITVICAGLIMLSGCSDKAEAQDLDYTELTDMINNPDQGFYRTAVVGVGKETVTDRTYIIKDETQLYHLRMDISEFSGAVNGDKDIELTEAALDNIDSMLSVFAAKEKNVVIRFAYDPDFDGEEDKEPDVEMIVRHIEQLSAVLNKYPVTLTAIEVGLVGPWGEMHSSEIANAQTISRLIDAFLDNTREIPILVRTPEMIYNYLGITLDEISSSNIPSQAHKAYRLGLFNDGYLGSGSDLGTYDDREKEIEWISEITDHLPYGGEVTKPDSTLHDIDKCLPEMQKINLSYLNYEWNDTVVQKKWMNSYYDENCGEDSLYYGQTAFKYIQNHLGYRLVLEKSVIGYSSSRSDLDIELTVKNVGFGNLNRAKNMTLYFADESGNVITKHVGSYNGEGNIKISADLDIPSGNYSVYLGLNTLIGEKTTYEIRFANDLWNDELSANLIGYITVDN